MVLAQTFYPTFVEINLESVTKAYHDLFYGALHEDNTLDALLGFNSFDWLCCMQSLINWIHSWNPTNFTYLIFCLDQQQIYIKTSYLSQMKQLYPWL